MKVYVLKFSLIAGAVYFFALFMSGVYSDEQVQPRLPEDVSSILEHEGDLYNKGLSELAINREALITALIDCVKQSTPGGVIKYVAMARAMLALGIIRADEAISVLIDHLSAHYDSPFQLQASDRHRSAFNISAEWPAQRALSEIGLPAVQPLWLDYCRKDKDVEAYARVLGKILGVSGAREWLNQKTAIAPDNKTKLAADNLLKAIEQIDKQWKKANAPQQP